MICRPRPYDLPMRLVRLRPIFLVFAMAGVFSSSAAAAKVYAPPGKAGATQYSETLPASGGNVAPPGATPYTGSGKPGSLGPIAKLGSGAAGVRHLAKLGTEGQAAAGFAQATAPAAVTPDRAGAPAGASGGSAVHGLLSLLGGSDAGGIGLFFPALLALSLLAALVAAGIQRSRAH